MFDIIIDNMSIVWVVIMVVFLVVEAATAGLTCIWFAIGALAALIAALFGAPIWLQLVWFFVVSVVTLYFTRPLVLKYVNSRSQPTNADMVIGSRFITKEGFQSSGLRRVGIRYFTWLIHLLTGKTITDPTSGLRMVNRSVIQQYASCYPKDYPEPESVVTILKERKRVEEVPVIMLSLIHI